MKSLMILPCMANLCIKRYKAWNGLTGGLAITGRLLKQYCVLQVKKKTWHIIDLGCGGGDLALAVAKSLSRHKIECTITGIDGNANTLAYAEKNVPHLMK